VANANGNGIPRLFGGATTTIISAVVIALSGAVLTMWRDVSVMQRRQETTLDENARQHEINRDFAIESERQRQIVDALLRFRISYDKKEAQTDESIKFLHQHIIELQQKVRVLDDHVHTLEQEQKPPRNIP
jgi:hypothetical protein